MLISLHRLNADKGKFPAYMNLKTEDSLLIDLLRYQDDKNKTDIEDHSSDEWERIISAAQKHAVFPLLYSRLKDELLGNQIPSECFKRLELMYHAILMNNTHMFSRLKNLLCLLNKKHIPVIVLKGAHLAELIYADVGMRASVDVDLLFRKDDVGKAQECLEELGYASEKDRDKFDIHWYLEQYLEIDMESVWRRTQKVQIAGEPVLALSPEALIVHLCIHTSFHHLYKFFALRTFFDIYEIIRCYKDDLNWEEVVICSDEWGVKHSVFLTLLLAEELVGVGVPGDVLKQLRSGEFNVDKKSWAVKQIFDDFQRDPSLSLYFWQLWQPSSFLNKLGLVKKLLVPSSEFISQKYPTISGTAKNRLFYLIRFRDHLIRYIGALLKIVFRDTESITRLKQKKIDYKMMEWLGSDRHTSGS